MLLCWSVGWKNVPVALTQTSAPAATITSASSSLPYAMARCSGVRPWYSSPCKDTLDIHVSLCQEGHLYDVNDSAGEVPDDSPGYLGVDEAVPHDQDMEQRFSQWSTILHLPDCPVVLPGEEWVKLGHSWFINIDLLFLIISELPAHVLRPCDQLPLPVPVHQGAQLLHHILQTLQTQISLVAQKLLLIKIFNPKFPLLVFASKTEGCFWSEQLTFP